MAKKCRGLGRRGDLPEMTLTRVQRSCTEVINQPISEETTMKNSRLLALSIPLITLFIFAMPIVRAQDMVKVAPKNCKVLLENDQVRVVRVVLKPGEKLEMHSHPANIVYAFSSGKAKYTSPDGKTQERETKAGQAVWSDAVTHSAENVGAAETRVLVIELKK